VFAHIRTLARGLIEKIFARLGAGPVSQRRLVDELERLAIGEYLSAQAELRRSPHLISSQDNRYWNDSRRCMLRCGSNRRQTTPRPS